jgi:hypothetical protein
MPCKSFGPIRIGDEEAIAEWQAACKAEGLVPVRGPEFASGGKLYFAACCCDNDTDGAPSVIELRLLARGTPSRVEHA